MITIRTKPKSDLKKSWNFVVLDGFLGGLVGANRVGRGLYLNSNIVYHSQNNCKQTNLPPSRFSSPKY